MPQYGFVIDNRKCIGCHACSTACKSENEVPLGVHRTWVKYVEKGTFPDVRRHFQVTRCNHCANPPCVPICPTTAMFQRPDGIVEFDSQRCIGCKACMQACPYDAIHIDPSTGTAAKCHYCAHRTEVGLEPACVVVCPEHAILAGDLDDPRSEIARVVAAHKTRARKPEAGTRPKLFYVEAEETALVPGLARQDQGMLWAEWPGGGPFAPGVPGARGAAGSSAGGVSDWRGPIELDGTSRAAALVRSASAGARETYNVAHRIPWHWQVPTYLVTKALGAGAFAIAAVGMALGWLPTAALFARAAPLVALAMTAVTTALLVGDLDRPERFLYILTKPQWKSWLVRGALVLMGFSAACAAFLASTWSLAPGDPLQPLARGLVWPGTVLAVLTAIYTAFLFAQCKGRDAWRSPLLPLALLVEMALAGSAALLILGPLFDLGWIETVGLMWIFAVSSSARWLVLGLEKVAAARSGAAAARPRAHHRRLHALAVAASVLGSVSFVPVLLGLGGAPGFALALAAAGALGIAGLLAGDWVFVMAPQELPNN